MNSTPVNGFINSFLRSANLMVNYVGQEGPCPDPENNMKPFLVKASNSSLSISPSSTASSNLSSSHSEFLPSHESGGPITVDKSPASPASSVASTISSSSTSQNANEIAMTANDNYRDENETGNESKASPQRTHVPYILNGQLYEIQSQEGENVTVKCCHCPSNRVYRGSVRSTGNFHMHIKVC